MTEWMWECVHTLIHNFRWRNCPPADSKGCRLRLLESWSYLLPCVTFTDDIWGNIGHVLSTLWVGFTSRFLADFFFFFYTRLCRRALLRTPAQAERRRGAAELNSDNGATEGGQVLAEVVVCAVGLSYYPLWRWLRNLLPCWRWRPTALERNPTVRFEEQWNEWRR